MANLSSSWSFSHYRSCHPSLDFVCFQNLDIFWGRSFDNCLCPYPSSNNLCDLNISNLVNLFLCHLKNVGMSCVQSDLDSSCDLVFSNQTRRHDGHFCCTSPLNLNKKGINWWVEASITQQQMVDIFPSVFSCIVPWFPGSDTFSTSHEPTQSIKFIPALLTLALFILPTLHPSDRLSILL